MAPVPLISCEKKSSEQPGYFEVGADHLFSVLHPIESPLARILLFGPFAPERNQSYLHWVRWARYLQARDIEVLRFDYRGVGESTGRFEDQTLATWMKDACDLASWLEQRKPRAPLILNGLTLGALIAAKCFNEGCGDGLLLWSPPANANVVLHSALVKWVTLQKLTTRAEQRKPFAAYLRDLTSKGRLEVNGYIWSQQLWEESFEFNLPPYLSGDTAASYNRAVSILELGRNATPLVCGGLIGYEESNDLTWLYASQHQWITWAIRQPVGETRYEAGTYDQSARHA